MSTSVIHPGSTGTAGPSGRLVGLVIAGLAAAIALGFVFASNQANETTEAVPVVRSVDQNAIWESKIDFLTKQHQAQAARRPDTNIELYKLQTAGLVGTGNEITPALSPEAVKALQNRAQVHIPSIVSAVPAPVFSPEAARVQPQLEQYVPSIVSAVPAPVFSPELARMQAVNSSRLQAMWSQRYQDLIDRFENLTVPKGQAVFSASWSQDVMDQYAERMFQANATDEEPVKLPREKRS